MEAYNHGKRFETKRSGLIILRQVGMVTIVRNETLVDEKDFSHITSNAGTPSRSAGSKSVTSFDT